MNTGPWIEMIHLGQDSGLTYALIEYADDGRAEPKLIATRDRGAAGCHAIAVSEQAPIHVCEQFDGLNPANAGRTAQGRATTSPCVIDIQPPSAAVQVRNASAIPSNSAAVANPRATACSAIEDRTTRSVHIPPQ